MKFEDQLIILRKEKGWSQEELGYKIGVSRQTISKWESALTTPEMDKLIELSQVFEVSIDELVQNKQFKDRENQEVRVMPYMPFFRYWVFEYEYKSKKELFGMPLVHINTGFGIKKAKGIIAIGNIATGIFTMGLLSMGLFSIGLLSIGLVALGTFSIGLLSIGAIAFGFLAIGAIAIGMYTIGAVSIASHIAVGAFARGRVAIGDDVYGKIEFALSGKNYSPSIAIMKDTILQELPNTPRFILDLLLGIAKSMFR